MFVKELVVMQTHIIDKIQDCPGAPRATCRCVLPSHTHTPKNKTYMDIELLDPKCKIKIVGLIMTRGMTKISKTYNSGYSPVVTHLTTNPPVSCLSTAEQTGCAILKILWSYVKESMVLGDI